MQMKLLDLRLLSHWISSGSSRTLLFMAPYSGGVGQRVAGVTESVRWGRGVMYGLPRKSSPNVWCARAIPPPPTDAPRTFEGFQRHAPSPPVSGVPPPARARRTPRRAYPRPVP